MSDFDTYVTESDKFIEMSTDAQCLFFHLCAGQEHGRVNNVLATIRRINFASDGAINELIENGFLKEYDDEQGIYSIKGCY